MAIRVAPKNIVRFNSLEEFLETSETPQGTFCVTIGGIPVDFDYEDRGYAVTGIFFQAAIGPKVEHLPVFLGKRFSEHVPVNRLFVSDPSLYVNKRLRLAWYAGNLKQPTLQGDLSRIFAKVSKRSRTLYFGTSGGGFAALAFSAEHDGSLAVAVNPQTDLADYQPVHVARWTNLAWGMGNSADEPITMPPVTTNVRPLYAEHIKNHVVYVQNTGDTSHMERQWSPFKESIHPLNSVTPLVQFSGQGHVAPPSKFLAELLTVLAETKSWAAIDLSSMVETPLRS